MLKIDNENVKEKVLNIFAIIIFLLPIVPEILDMGIYSIKATIILITTFLTEGILFFIALKDKSIKITCLDIILLIYLFWITLSTIFANYGIKAAILGTNGRGEGLLMLICYGLIFDIFSKGYKYLKNTLKIL